MSLNNLALTLLFAFSLCKVIWLFMYIQISLFLSAFSLHIAIASLIACSFAFIMIILPEILVALLHLMSSCINITVVSISVSTSAIFFQICDASVYITMFFVFLIRVFCFKACCFKVFCLKVFYLRIFCLKVFYLKDDFIFNELSTSLQNFKHIWWSLAMY